MLWGQRFQGLLLLALVLKIATTDALYQKGGPVQLLSHKTFDATVLQSDLPAVVEFFAPWCGHCKALAPAYNKVASNLEGILTVGAVDCDDAANRAICGQYGIQGFPTIKIFPSKSRVSSSTKKSTKSPTDYNGPRTAKGIADAATAALPDAFITRVQGTAGLDSFQAQSDLPKVLLVSSKARSTPLYKGLSARFSRQLTFGEARDTDEAVKQALGVTKSPQLLLLPAAKGAEPVPYTGNLKALELIKFLQQHAGPGSKQGSAKPSAEAEADETGGQKQKETPQVVDIIRSEGVEAVAGQEDAHLLAFFSGAKQTCAKETAAFNALVASLGGLIKGSAVNVTAGDSLASRGWELDAQALKAKPCDLQLLLKPFGDSAEPDEWQRFSGKLEAKEVQKWALQAFPARVARIDESSLQPLLALEPQVPKVLLFTDKEAAPPLFAALSVNLRARKLLFADVHASQKAVMEQFGVTQVPAMRVAFLPPEGLAESAPGEDKGQRLAIQAFPGPYTYAAMAAFLGSLADAVGLHDEEQPSQPGGAGDDKAPAPVPQVNDQAALSGACPPSGGICVLGVLDKSSPGFESHLQTLQGVAGRHRTHPLRFAWLDAPQQPTFLEAFSLAPPDAPTLLAFSASKQRQVHLRGTYGAEAISDLLRGLLGGRQATSPLQEVPRLVDGGQGAQEGGGAGGPGEAEEEFDLADILEEAVQGSASKEARLEEIEAQLQDEARQRAEGQKASTPKKSKRRKKGGSKAAGTAKDEL